MPSVVHQEFGWAVAMSRHSKVEQVIREGPDGTLVICWAGYDHLQQAQAISAYDVRVQTEFGGSESKESRLRIVMLACWRYWFVRNGRITEFQTCHPSGWIQVPSTINPR
jgi:hypothetical protein